MLEKCLCGKTHNANESLNVMIWNCVLKATLIRLDMLFVGVYDAMAHFNNDETVALDNMELLKIDPGYYITKCCRSFRMYRKRSSIYRMMEPKKKNDGRSWVIPNKSKNIETETTSDEMVSFENPVLANWFHCLLFYVCG